MYMWEHMETLEVVVGCFSQLLSTFEIESHWTWSSSVARLAVWPMSSKDPAVSAFVLPCLSAGITDMCCCIWLLYECWGV